MVALGCSLPGVLFGKAQYCHLQGLSDQEAVKYLQNRVPYSSSSLVLTSAI